jgi:predicted MFS family arabinose efflux permease
MGVYNTSQSLGIFAGGALGGVLAQQAGENGVFVTAALLMAAGFLVARGARRWPMRHGIGDPRKGAPGSSNYRHETSP